MFRPVETGLEVLAACRAQAPEHMEFLAYSWEGKHPHLDLLSGTVRVYQGLVAGTPVRDLAGEWREGVNAFIETRDKYLLYPRR